MDLDEMILALTQYRDNKALATGRKNDPTLPPVGPYPHGAGGIFSQTGTDDRIFSAINVPQAGAFANIPVLDTMSIPYYGGYNLDYVQTITGLTGTGYLSDANQPDAPCEDGAPMPLMKLCALAVPFNDYSFKIDTIDFKNIGTLLNGQDNPNWQVVNSPDFDANALLPAVQGLGEVLNDTLQQRTMLSYMGAWQYMTRKVYTANPANSAASTNWKDGIGLDLWINTGNKRDAVTGDLCGALDSRIIDYNYADIATTGGDLVTAFERMIYALDARVSRQGLGTQWDGLVLMRGEAWEILSQNWPIAQYQKIVAAMAANNPAVVTGQIFVGGAEALADRNAIRNSMLLPVRGRFIRVVIDDSIPEETSVTNAVNLTGAQKASDIYFVPLRVLGNIPVTYFKAWRWNAGVYEAFRRAAGSMGAGERIFTSERGAVMWSTNWRNFCFDANWTTRYKLIMHTPQIAGRLINMKYTAVENIPAGYVDDPNYVAGGRGVVPAVPVYTMWNAGTPVNF